MTKKLKDDDAPGGYSSTARQIKEFTENVVWREMSTEINEWMISLLEDLVEGTDDSDIKRTQGRIQALKKVLLLPKVMFESAELEADEKSKQRQAARE